MTDLTTAGPVAPKDRILALDVLRGWAILGILAVNAAAFAWPASMLMADMAPPGSGPADVVGTWVMETFFSDKFRTLFTLLFGASIFLVGGETKDETRGRALWRRLGWLALFGVIHGAAFWYGDILLHYAYCGLIVMTMRSMSAKKLLWIGGGVSLLWAVVACLSLWGMQNLPPEATAQMQAGMPTADAETIAATVEAYRQPGFGWLMENLKAWGLFQLVASPFLLPVTVPLMMLGMGLLKSGFLTGRAPTWIYVGLLLLGGANLAAFGWYGWIEAQAPEGENPTGGLAAAAGGAALLITLGYASLLLLMTRFGLGRVTGLLAPVGRMAFTNYLTQTLVMTFLFYLPGGPKWFGTMGPAELWAVVGAMWVAQLIWSPLWLSRFQMGPLEWLWRCLTYGRMVPLLKGR